MLTKLKIGKYKYSVDIEKGKQSTLIVRFGWNQALIDEIKTFQGARWHPEDKYWTISDSARNHYQLAFMQGQNPYAWFDRSLIDWTPYGRECFRCRGKGCAKCRNGELFPYAHQVDLVRQGLTYRRTILAGSMGIGKTLALIYIMECSGEHDWLYVGPRSALASVQIEFKRWKSLVTPRFATYEESKKLVLQGELYPNVAFDEASRIMNATTQRSQAAMILAEHVRRNDDYEDWLAERNGFIIEMSGTPAPKDPTNWWHLAEVAQPGFLREGDPIKFKKRLAIIQYKDSISGGVYPELVSWLDDETKCALCGKFQHEHTPRDHEWKKSKNEVLFLFERMKGLVMVKDKKTCLDLPDKQYRIIRIEPTQEILNAAAMITASSSRAITALTLHRSLSDGFQYREVEKGVTKCRLCMGTGQVSESIAPETELFLDPEMTECPHCNADVDGFSNYCYNCGEQIAQEITKAKSEHAVLEANDEGNVTYDFERDDGTQGFDLVTCPHCDGSGQVPKIVRIAKQVDSPKTKVLEDLLDEHEDVGRIIIYAGFTGSIDRCVETCKKMGWETLRVDGRGWDCSLGRMTDVEALTQFQEGKGRLAYVAHPQSGGMGVTLTASPTAVYYSNDFNYESRAQSEDRPHRIGMDVNRGCTIIDLFHLPSDELVYDNLMKKERLQSMTMGKFTEQIKLIQESSAKREM